jgi:hypothetical protein
MTTTTTLDPDFASAVRAELAAIGTKKSRLRQHQRHTRLAITGIAAIAVAVATTGAALVVNGFPGSTTVTPLGTVVTATHTGTGTIDLGPVVKGATSIVIDVTCISHAGNISVPSTSGFSEDASGKVQPLVGMTGWDCAKRSTTVHIRDGYLAPHSASITVTADPGTTWRALARYASSTTSAFGVNAHGQTFGAANAKDGFPDLQGAQATNGKLGYISTKEWNAFRGRGYINVYESDGTTVIGKFSIGEGAGASTGSTDVPTPPGQ